MQSVRGDINLIHEKLTISNAKQCVLKTSPKPLDIKDEKVGGRVLGNGDNERPARLTTRCDQAHTRDTPATKA